MNDDLGAGSHAGLRLLLVIDSLGSGGAQRQMVTLALALAARGHVPEFLIYQPDHLHFAPELEAAGIPVHHVRKGHRFSLAPAMAVRRLLRTNRYDVVVAYLPTPSLYAELATLFHRHPPLVVSERSAFVGTRPSWIARFLARFHRLADAVVVNSHHHREAMEQAFPWIGRRIHTIWNGVDFERFAPPVGPVADRGDALLAVGSIRPLKNAQALAQALVLLHRSGRRVPLVRWAGKLEPHPASAAERAAVDAMLAAAGLSHRWEWLGERRDIAALMHGHAALIHPSMLEGLPNAVCESLASGLPVLAGSVGDQARLVAHERSGLLFDPASPQSIADVIASFMRLDAASRAAMGQAGVAFAREHLSVTRATDQYESLLTALAAAARGQGGYPPRHQ